MIVILKQNAPADKVPRSAANWIRWASRSRFGRCEHPYLGLIGDTKTISESWLLANPLVERCRRVSEPYKKANRKFHPDDTVVTVGSEHPVKIAAGISP